MISIVIVQENHRELVLDSIFATQCISIQHILSTFTDTCLLLSNRNITGLQNLMLIVNGAFPYVYIFRKKLIGLLVFCSMIQKPSVISIVIVQENHRELVLDSMFASQCISIQHILSTFTDTCLLLSNRNITGLQN